MADDHGPVVQSAVLRNELVRLRRASRLSQYEVAHELGWPPSSLIRMEGGRRPITTADLDKLLTRYGADSEAERERLHGLNRGAGAAGWWDAYRSEVPGPYLDYVGYEAGTVFLRQFPGTVVPGLLQTPEYAEALTSFSVDPVQVGAVVDVRLHRQSELQRRSRPPQQYYVLDESVIRRHVGTDRDRGIMPNQLRYIADTAAGNESITVRVIPFNAGVHAGLSGPFTLLEFDDSLSDLLYLDTGRGELATLTGNDPDVAEYADKFESLLDFALPEDQSLELIRSAAEEML
jgi:transcriptional regulator with XRE-family HTH domain